MKKNILCLPFMAALLLGSCSKQEKSLTGKQTPASKKMDVMATPSFTYYVYGKDITEEDFLRNKRDAADEKFNYVNHAMTLGLLEISKDPTLLSNLVQAIDSKPGSQINLYNYADNNPSVDAIFNQIFSQRFSDFSSYSNNWRTYVAANYVYDTTYIPFARFINQTDVDINAVPYYSEPFDIDEGKFPDFNNNLPLWISNGSNFLFSTIDENMSFNIHNPIIAIVNGHLGDDALVQLATNKGIKYNGGVIPPMTTMSCGLNPLPAYHTHEAISHTKFKIDYAYEGGDDNASEYFVEFSTYRAYKAESPQAWGPYGPNSGHNALRHQEYSVSRANIGTMIDFTFEVFTPNNYAPLACVDFNSIVQSQTALQLDRYFLFAAYERDWGNQGKILGGVFRDDGIQAYNIQYGNRKYDSEWYFLNPYTNMGYPVGASSYPSPSFPILQPRNATPNSTYINYEKGEVQLKRHAI